MSPSSEPMVGIFWLYGDKLITDCTALSEAEPYADSLTHPCGHLGVWTELQRRYEVPGDVEYEEPPRGRVQFNRRLDRFLLLADPCILKRAGVVRQIMATMHLPEDKTEVGSDAHYRCARCLSRSRDDE
jgi:hypothetical protein